MLDEEKNWDQELIQIPRSKWTLGNLLTEKAEKNAGKVFLLFQDESVTYDEFEVRSNQVANALISLGVKKGDKIGVFLPNCPEFLFIWFGIAKIGAVMVPYNSEWKGEILSYILNHSDTRAMILYQDYYDQLMEVLPKSNFLDFLVIKKGNKENLPPRSINLNEFFNQSTKFSPIPLSPHDSFQIMYTSGTTGRSKGVVRWHEYVILRALRAIRIFGYTSNDVFYTALPLYHGNAQNLSTLPALLVNGKLALGKRFSASQFWSDIKKYKATTFNYIGAMIPILYKQPETEFDKDHNVRFARGAGAPPDIILDFEKRFNLTLIESYGTTEGGSIHNIPERKIGSLGKPPYYNEAKIFDENDQELPPYKIGELVFRPKDPDEKWVEYYKDPMATAEKMKGGWFRSGDLAYIDKEGFFFFKGRKKDAIRRRGENISAQEVETVINSHPAILECAAFGVPSELSEEEVMVCMVLKSGYNVTYDEMIQYCEDHMALFMIPRYLEFMPSLPKTPTLRVEKYKLKERGITSNTWDREKRKLVSE